MNQNTLQSALLTVTLFIALLMSGCRTCGECRECKQNPTTGAYNKDCTEYEEHCGNELQVRERADAFVCK